MTFSDRCPQAVTVVLCDNNSRVFFRLFTEIQENRTFSNLGAHLHQVPKFEIVSKRNEEKERKFGRGGLVRLCSIG